MLPADVHFPDATTPPLQAFRDMVGFVIRYPLRVVPERMHHPQSPSFPPLSQFRNQTPISMNLPSSQFLRVAEPPVTTVSSPRLDLIVLAWEHIADRYLKRLESNRIRAGRVRSIRQLAVHDAIQSVIDPGNGHIYRGISDGFSTDAASAAAVRAAHDILAAVFPAPADRADLQDLLEESLGLVGSVAEKAAGVESGAQSAAAYLKAFAPLLAEAGPARTDSISHPLFLGDRGRWLRSA